MREYARFAPRFWTGPTGRAIKAKGRDAQVLAIYLFTGPQSNMIGLYYLPLPTLCHEAGFTPEEARTTLQALAAIGFAYYDEEDELVWVPTAAVYQIGDHLLQRDKRAAGAKNLLRPFQRHKFGRQFIERYRRAYSLQINDEPNDLARTIEAPSKPGEGTGAGAGEGTGTTTPPHPPSCEGGGASAEAPEAPDDSAAERAQPDATSNGTREGPGLNAAIGALVAHWRRLGSYDPSIPGGWGDSPVTIPEPDRIRNWRRDLRSGRRTVGEIRDEIAVTVRKLLIQMGRVEWGATWPPEEEANPPPGDDG